MPLVIAGGALKQDATLRPAVQIGDPMWGVTVSLFGAKATFPEGTVPLTPRWLPWLSCDERFGLRPAIESSTTWVGVGKRWSEFWFEAACSAYDT